MIVITVRGEFPPAAFLAPPSTVLFPDGMGAHMVGHHGGPLPKNFSYPYYSPRTNPLSTHRPRIKKR